MTKKSDTPAIRFKGFTDTWEQCNYLPPFLRDWLRNQ